MRKTLKSTYQPSPQSAIACLHQGCCDAAPEFVHTDHSNGVSMSTDDVSLENTCGGPTPHWKDVTEILLQKFSNIFPM